jgi:Fur family ferric uptake transcriptional regulator
MIEEALQKFELYLKKNNLKMTNQRQFIAQDFFSHQGHISAEELYRIVEKKIPEVGFTTVYRTLRLLVDAGLASSHNFKGSHTRFEPAGQLEHHDHLICTVCGRITEFINERIEKLQNEVARQHDFQMTDHTLEIFGICAICDKN